jgi:hypothetical protein
MTVAATMTTLISKISMVSGSHLLIDCQSSDSRSIQYFWGTLCLKLTASGTPLPRLRRFGRGGSLYGITS